jgi:D-alanyl-D-alanine carboxypeptidase (penicillin-binding protein 5/6)
MATYVGGSSLFLKAGQKLMLEEVLGAAMVRSGNDAAYTVAEHIGGTEAKFVQMMNKRASALKMKSTAFYNSTGMPNKNGIDNVSTAADMLLLAREMVKYDCILDYTAEAQTRFVMLMESSPMRIEMHSSNHLMKLMA